MANTWASQKCLAEMACARRITMFPNYSWKYASFDKSFEPAWLLLSRMDFAEEFKREDYGGEGKEIQQLVNSDAEEYDSSIIYADRVLTHMQGKKI